jgi:hypothetical protein
VAGSRQQRDTRLTDGAPPPVVPRLLNRDGAAQYLSVSVATLDALRSRGFLRAVHLPSTKRFDERGRTPLFDRADLDRFIDEHKEA